MDSFSIQTLYKLEESIYIIVKTLNWFLAKNRGWCNTFFKIYSRALVMHIFWPEISVWYELSQNMVGSLYNRGKTANTVFLCIFCIKTWCEYIFGSGHCRRLKGMFSTQIYYQKLWSHFFYKKLKIQGFGQYNYVLIKKKFLEKIRWPYKHIWCQFGQNKFFRLDVRAGRRHADKKTF